MFRVQRKQCSTCIYRDDCPLDIDKLEADVADNYGAFRSHRQCHHTNDSEPACCAGFWARHKDKFQAGQIAQRLDMVQFVDVDQMESAEAFAQRLSNKWKTQYRSSTQ